VSKQGSLMRIDEQAQLPEPGLELTPSEAGREAGQQAKAA